MQYVNLGSLKFSRIVQGFFRTHSWGMDAKQLHEHMAACMDRGVTTFDTADVYGGGGRCEKAMGEALVGFNRDQYQLVTKAGICRDFVTQTNHYDTTYEYLTNSCKASAQRLGVDYIDLFLIHREDPMIDPHEAGRALLDLKKEGVIREFGVSNFDPFKYQAVDKATGGQLVTNQIEVNPCCFEHFNSGMIDYLTGEKIAPMVWSPLAGGKTFTSDEPQYVAARKAIEELAEKYNVLPGTIVYAWILNHPMNALPIVGSGKLPRLDEAIAALDLKLDRIDWFKVYRASGQQIIR